VAGTAEKTFMISIFSTSETYQ